MSKQVAILPATLPVLTPALHNRIAGLANSDGKLTQAAAWRVMCAVADTKALLDAKFKVLVGANPKRGAGKLAFEQYGGLSGTKGSCAAYAEKVGHKNAVRHLLWDLSHGYIGLTSGGKAVEIPAWCAPGAKVPARKERKARVPRKPKAPVVVEAAPSAE